jgi:hypothetical protein
MFTALMTETSDRITRDWLLNILIEQLPTREGHSATVTAEDALSGTFKVLH